MQLVVVVDSDQSLPSFPCSIVDFVLCTVPKPIPIDPKVS